MSNATVTIHPGRMHRSVFDLKTRLNYRIGFLTICFLTIAVISTIDIWFAVANSSILAVEQNPICKALIEMDQSRFSFFILGKTLGTVIVLSTSSCDFCDRCDHTVSAVLADIHDAFRSVVLRLAKLQFAVQRNIGFSLAARMIVSGRC
jgi:hypothetical protein